MNLRPEKIQAEKNSGSNEIGAHDLWTLCDTGAVLYQLNQLGLMAQLVEHCTGIADVMGSNPEFFSGVNFTTASVVCITTIIIKITISSIVIGLKNSYFPLIHLSSCYRTVCYRTVQ